MTFQSFLNCLRLKQDAVRGKRWRHGSGRRIPWRSRVRKSSEESWYRSLAIRPVHNETHVLLSFWFCGLCDWTMAFPSRGSWASTTLY